MRWARIAAAVVLAVATGASCRSECAGASCGRRPLQIVVRAGSQSLTFTVEVASTPQARQLGLMNRAEVPPGTGMLFLFPAPTREGFWMKNTLVPLDVAFIRAGRVVEVRAMTPCLADPCPLTIPGSQFDRALEVAKGQLASVEAGASAEVSGSLPSPS